MFHASLPRSLTGTDLAVGRYAEELYLPQTFGDDWRTPSDVKSNTYTDGGASGCGRMGATCVNDDGDGCKELSLEGYEPLDTTPFIQKALEPPTGVGYVLDHAGAVPSEGGFLQRALP